MSRNTLTLKPKSKLDVKLRFRERLGGTSRTTFPELGNSRSSNQELIATLFPVSEELFKSFFRLLLID